MSDLLLAFLRPFHERERQRIAHLPEADQSLAFITLTIAPQENALGVVFSKRERES